MLSNLGQIRNLIQSHKIKAENIKVDSIAGDALFAERLQEVGIHQGCTIHFVGQAPFNGPLLFQIDGIVIALREEEAQCIQVQVK